MSLISSDPGLGLELLLGVSSMFTKLRSGRTRTSPLGTAAKPVKRPSHVMPRLPIIDLSGPGRLRTAHVLALAAISHSTLCTRIKAGKFPPPDGQDGRLNYWATATLRTYLAQSA